MIKHEIDGDDCYSNDGQTNQSRCQTEKATYGPYSNTQNDTCQWHQQTQRDDCQRQSLPCRSHLATELSYFLSRKSSEMVIKVDSLALLAPCTARRCITTLVSLSALFIFHLLRHTNLLLLFTCSDLLTLQHL